MSKKIQNSKNLKIFSNLEKIIIFSKKFKFLKKYFLPKKHKKKNAILLVLLIEEINLWPELYSPLCFRIQGRQTKFEQTEILVSYIGRDATAAIG